MKHLVMFSGGVSSWAAGRRVVDRYGPDDVTLLFANTKIEDADLYRFLLECHWNLGASLMMLSDGRTPWQVFEDERYIGNSRIDPCSRVLKRELLNRYRDENFDPADTTIYYGLSWYEPSRVEDNIARVAESGWKCEMPLTWEPHLDKDEELAWCRSYGIEPPRLYAEGFLHNNCGGMCVKAGQAQWAHLYAKRPETYLNAESEEARLNALGIKGTILVDRRGVKKGQKRKPLSLKDFRIRLIQEGAAAYDPNDIGGCGCALPV